MATLTAEALAKSTEYFGGDELAANVYLTKYAVEGEDTPDKMHNRLAAEFARIEKNHGINALSEQNIFDYFDKFNYIVPQGSPMAGIGNPAQVMSISNCFVIQSPYDSYAGILKTDQEQAQLMKRRGGVGFDISPIRPKGLKTNNAAKTTDGIEVFMERWSNTTREVAQGGRRGALMLTIDVRHPDIETFVTIKSDLTKVTGANISVRLTDDFMKAVKTNDDFVLQWPVDSATPTITRTIKAAELWDKIITLAHQNAEPGLLFWDTVQRRTPADAYPEFKSVSTNPCQPAWAPVLTPGGVYPLGKLKPGMQVWSEDGWVKVTNIISSGVKDVYRYRTNAGVFYGTENHRIVSNGTKVEVGQAESIDVLRGTHNMWSGIDLVERHPDSEHKNFKQAVMDGLVIGDGGVHQASNDLVYLCVGEDDESYHDSEVGDLLVKNRVGIKPYAWTVKTTIKAEQLPLAHLREVPEFYRFNTSVKACGFLRGVFSANGSVVANGTRVTLKSNSVKLIEQVQVMLSALGIRSYFTTNKTKKVQFANGDYQCRESYDLNITTDRGVFAKRIGFLQPYKNEKINLTAFSGKSKMTYDIVSVDQVSWEEVFDITVDGPSHTYWSGGLNVSNCGEIVLSPYDSCRLLLINVAGFVKDPFSSTPTFDTVGYGQAVRVGQRLMDDMVDLELECIDRILAKIEADPEPADVKRFEIELWQKVRNACERGRRTGLGLTGVGDAVAYLNIQYGSDEGVETVEMFYRELALNSYRESVQLAKERGAFPAYDYELEKNHEFINQIMDLDPQLRADWVQYGRRNIANTTTAPAGSVSMLTQTTSGIENAYLLMYDRNKKINPSDVNAEVSFIDAMGDKWQTFRVYHHGFKKWMEVTGKTDPSESPYAGSTSNDIDWTMKVKVQAAAQKWICHAISNTTNLPNDATVETVKEIYMTGWESGCKGVTIYRDGSRTGVLVAAKDKEEEKVGIKQVHAPKRPQELPCDIHNMTVQGERWTFFIGLLDGQPYELMGGLSENIKLPRRVKQGKIVKHNGPKNPIARYDLHYDFEKGEDDEAVIADVTNVFNNTTYATFTRTLSLALRHGAPVQFVVEQLLKGTDEDLFSFSKAASRVLKQYIEDGTKRDKKCLDCGDNNLSYQDGCMLCLSCGSSKCG